MSVQRSISSATPTSTPCGCGSGRRAPPRRSPPSAPPPTCARSSTASSSTTTRPSCTGGSRSTSRRCSQRIQRLVQGRASGTSWAAGTCSRTATCPAASRSSARCCWAGATSARSSASTPDDRHQLRPVRPHAAGWCRSCAKCGYDSYLFCRPGQDDCPLPAGRLRLGRVRRLGGHGRRGPRHYNSPLGEAAREGRGLDRRPSRATACGLVLWGVGNHGGGPSRKDLRDLRRADARERRTSRSSTPRPRPTSPTCAPSRARLPRIERRPEPLGRRLLHLAGAHQAEAPPAGERAVHRWRRWLRPPRSRG